MDSQQVPLLGHFNTLHFITRVSSNERLVEESYFLDSSKKTDPSLKMFKLHFTYLNTFSVCVGTHVWQSEDNLMRLVLSSHRVESRLH